MDSVGPKGETGAHPTLAGNLFDPNVSADGRMSTGEGVGGTSADTVRHEGAEHLRNTTGTGTTSGLEGSSSSNYGSGIGSGLGSGMSSNEGRIHDEGIDHIKSNVGVAGSDASTEQSGILGGIKSYLGYGKTAETAEHDAVMEGRNYQDRNRPDQFTSEEERGILEGRQHEGRNRVPEESNNPLTSSEGVMSGRDYEARNRRPEEDNNPLTSSDGVMSGRDYESRNPGSAEKSVPDVETSDGVMQGRDHESREGGAHEGTLAEHENKLSDAAKGSARHNEDAIPTAGGIKLGSKHWGESQVVPDNPKPRASEAGISSSEGQPTDQVRDNTHANTGSAAPPGENATGPSSTEKHGGLADKLKNTLHVGGNKE
ncbi:hypothetical protein LTR56_001332 [Elasticomyces elasticus]|nr:hypothetical protein LTR56_001332 [Elasticomyces elasticus]KAK3667513.1 hypothetical protein LTR22_001691 [Elasticomyces elasticus]KAK4928007.1 hypothetical protein LTR49_005206 [Elasticomyces elasticus]KAK5762446.1 hypothetical protein LTS12_007423 [Elasticomyces elasticus]